MKTIYKIATLAVCAMVMLAACGNTGAKNEKKNKKAVSEVKEQAVKELDYKQFNNKVFDLNNVDELKYLGDKPAIVDFTASWCGPCQRVAPILEELAVEYRDKIYIYKIDIDKERELALEFGVSSIPAIFYIPADGNEPVMTLGARGKDKFKEEIKTLLHVE